MRRYVTITLAALALWLVGCQAQPAIVKSSDGDYEIDMWANSSCVHAGDTVHLRATVINYGKETKVIQLQDKPVLDITAPGKTGPIHWSDGKALTPDLTHLELSPGASKSIEMDWATDPGFTGLIPVQADFRDSENKPRQPAIAYVNVGICPGIGP